MTTAPTVSVVMIFLNAQRFMEEAIASVIAQTYADWEIILVDDGSSDGSSDIARAHVACRPDRIRYVEHEGHANCGMSPSRNLGISHARGRLITFIDSDDVWEPVKLEEQVALLDAHPSAGAVIGTPLYWQSWTEAAADLDRDHVPGLGFPADRLFEPPELLFKGAPLGTGPVPCPSDIMVRREAVDRVGGFEPRFNGAYEDTAFFVKLYLREPIVAFNRCWTRYRLHPESCMAITMREKQYETRRLFFLNWFEEYQSRHGLAGTEAWTRLQEQLSPYRIPLSLLAMTEKPSPGLLQADPNPVPIDSGSTTVSWSTPDGAVGQVWVVQNGGHESLFGEGSRGSQLADWINPGATYEFRLYADTKRARLLDQVTVGRLVDTGVGSESFGSLRRVVPISRTFGFDRGQPIDRYYIDQFLDTHAGDIHGRVLEIGESTYTRRFGGDRVSSADVLHVHQGNPEATIIDDLTVGTRLPSDAFDCVLLIQTLQFIFDVPAALRTVSRILKPGGIVLATFPGISQMSRDEWRESWYWSFTSHSARRLFGLLFPDSGLTIRTRGNVLATTAFLQGLASSELTSDELAYQDDCYETLITVRAVKSLDRVTG